MYNHHIIYVYNIPPLNCTDLYLKIERAIDSIIVQKLSEYESLSICKLLNDKYML